MNATQRLLLTLAAALLLGSALRAGDEELVPTQFPREQRENLLRFLQKHEKPDRYMPRDAKFIPTEPAAVPEKPETTPGKPIKQYTVQITPHRPVPGQEEVKRADVYYYRPNPEPGKPGITIKHTVDLTTGDQVGATEVLVNHHTPVAREELTEAVALAKEKSQVVKALYLERDKNKVQWEYLQMLISRKHEPHDPGDRVMRFVFSVKDDGAPPPVRVIVNLTKGIVIAEGDAP